MDSSWCEPWQWRFVAKTITLLDSGQITNLDESTKKGDSCVGARIPCSTEILFPTRTSRRLGLPYRRLIYCIPCRRHPVTSYWRCREICANTVCETSVYLPYSLTGSCQCGTRLINDRTTSARAATATDRLDVAANDQVFRWPATTARSLASNGNVSRPGIGSCDAPKTSERVCISIATARRASVAK